MLNQDQIQICIFNKYFSKVSEIKKEFIIDKYLKREFVGDITDDELLEYIYLEEPDLEKLSYDYFIQRY